MDEAGHRCFLIGDVHGHYQGLITLLELIAPAKEDQVYFLGDLIDRGPQSYHVVELVRTQNYHCLLGNHELLMLNALPMGKTDPASLCAWFYCGGRDTMDSYRNQEAYSLLEHVKWMQALPPYIDLGDVWLVHAGVDPTLPLHKQTSEQFCWIRNQFHRISEPFFADKTIITGHTITFTLPGIKPGQLAQGQGWLDIDTGAYHPKSGWMTALEWSQKMVYQVNIFDRRIRVRPLAEAATQVNPKRIK